MNVGLAERLTLAVLAKKGITSRKQLTRILRFPDYTQITVSFPCEVWNRDHTRSFRQSAADRKSSLNGEKQLKGVNSNLLDAVGKPLEAR